MDEHLISFIGALRAAGVRVSVAETLDALRAIAEAGVVGERATLRDVLRATLVKDHADRPAFERLFDTYFAGVGAALAQLDDGALDADDRARLRVAMAAALAQIASPAMAALFAAMAEGRALGHGQFAAMLAQTTPAGTGSPIFQSWMTRRALRELEFERLAALRAAGMGDAALAEIERDALANQVALAEQIGRGVARQMARHERPARPARPLEDLLDMPLRLLGRQDSVELRTAVARLAAQLRTRAATRRRRARRGPLDPRGTIRASMRYGGVPFAIRRRRRQLRPRLVVLCDVSSSMRGLAGLTLSLVYALHDQLSGTRSFAFIDELHDISADFADSRPAQAIAAVLARIRADYARTDLGICLDTFAQLHLADVDRRTTVLILGDGRNNRSDPGIASLRQIRARARHLIWLTPEPQRDWGTGDSDMLAYAPLCTAVHVVGSLRDLSAAVESILV